MCFRFILSDDDFEIKSKIYSFNLRLVLKHILHSQDDFFRNLVFTSLIKSLHNVLNRSPWFIRISSAHVDLTLN